ncbi:MAG: glycyl-radical enzyme activating protein [candidate division Zixibacteria bacterium]|nr:glycyl-radical enzyme activating protein [candidate division Zixibacteria bacterium]
MAKTGTIFDIKKFAIHDGPGIRTSVFFKGCPMDCWWCHNPESKRLEPEILNNTRRCKDEVVGYDIDSETVMTEIEKDRVFYDQSGGGVTFSGGEPMMQIEFLRSLLAACKQKGIHTAIDTCGHAPFDDFEAIYELVDLVLYDIKLMDETNHIKYTGITNKLSLNNLTRLYDKGIKITPRIPLVPDITDTAANLAAIAEYLRALPNIRSLSLLPYNKLGEDKFERFGLSDRMGQAQSQTESDILEKSRLFEAAGFEVKIGG